MRAENHNRQKKRVEVCSVLYDWIGISRSCFAFGTNVCQECVWLTQCMVRPSPFSHVALAGFGLMWVYFVGFRSLL